jgi:DNA-binding GntR family transcriptional regulator
MLNLQSLREQIYQFLRHQMQKGVLLPGFHIDIKKISEQLGVSTTPVRDALIVLQVEGFVSILPRKGVIVNALTIRDIKNLYEVIGALEASVVKSVFDDLDMSRMAAMEQIDGEYRQAILAGDSEQIYIKNLAFHGIFLDLSNNPELLKLIKPRKERLYDFPRRAYLQEWELRNSDEHRQLIDCIRKGDPDAAARVLRNQHWSFPYQEDYIRKFYSLAMEEYKEELDNHKNRRVFTSPVQLR